MSTPPNYISLQLTEAGAATISGDLGIPLINGTYSLSSWIQYDAFSSNAAIIEREGEVLLQAMDNGFMFQISGGPPLVWQSPAKLENGWYNLVVTYDNGTARLYVDGDFKQVAHISTGQTPSGKPLVLGSGLQGLLLNAIVYNTALSAGQVMDSQYSDLDPSLVAAHFDFTQNPPVDTGPKALPIALNSGCVPMLLTPGLYLESTAYAYPMHAGNVNPGGQHIDPYTVQTWVYVERAVPQQTLFVNSDLSADTGMNLSLIYDEASQAFQLKSRRGSAQNGEFVTSSININLQTWTNVATTFDGTTLSVYVNGVLAGSKACGPIPLSRPYGDIVIGAAFSETTVGGINSLQGFMSLIEVWDRALSAAEITQYMTDLPALDSNGLVALYDMITEPARDAVSGHAIGMADGALLSRQSAEAPHGTQSTQSLVSFDPPTVDEAKLAGWRETVNHDDFLAEHAHLIDAACEADAATQENPEDAQKIRDAYDLAKERLTAGAGDDMALTFTEHVENGRYYLVGHSRRGSYVAFEKNVADIDDCNMWKIKLVFIAVAGALDAIFGVSAKLSARAETFILRVLRNPRLIALLARGPAMNASVVFLVLNELYILGVLRELISLIVDLALWSFLRLVVKVLLIFAGVGAADVLASLAATAIMFIKTYTERPVSCDPLRDVTLAAIKFNHDPTHASVDALSIRVNKTTPVTIPEWVPGHTAASQSPAAYAIDQVSGKAVTIQAKFTINTKEATSVQIQVTSGGILGTIAPVTVNFNNGVSTPEYVTLSLPHHTLAGGGVQAVDASLVWQYKDAGHPWTPMTTSQHRIYAVLGTPTMPWKQNADLNETQLPWSEALEFGCAWASGQTTEDGALGAITQKINSGYGLRYDTTRGASVYTNPLGISGWTFLLTKFIDLLGGGAGAGKVVNCTDCATIVSTFANVLGGNIPASVMGLAGVGFDCNKIQAIGSTTWAYPFGTTKGHFSYHEVAWKTPSSYREAIYDACLKLDSSSNPWNWGGGTTHTPKLPEDMVFTNQLIMTALPIATPFTEQTYRERLAMNTNAGITACVPTGQWPKTQSGRRYVE